MFGNSLALQTTTIHHKIKKTTQLKKGSKDLWGRHSCKEDDPKGSEMMLSFTSHSGNTKQNHSEMPLHT